LKGGDKMKNWQKPVLEVLDVKMTMHSTTGTHYDADYSNGQPVPIDPNTGLHMDVS
jgi:hypothetical protein